MLPIRAPVTLLGFEAEQREQLQLRVLQTLRVLAVAVPESFGGGGIATAVDGLRAWTATVVIGGSPPTLMPALLDLIAALGRPFARDLLAGGSLDDLLLLLHLTSWKGRSRYDDGEAAGRGGKPRRTGGSSNDALLLAEVGRRALHALALLTRDESCAEVLCSRGLVRTLLTHLGPYAGSALAPTDALTDQRTLLSLLDVLAASNGCGT